MIKSVEIDDNIFDKGKELAKRHRMSYTAWINKLIETEILKEQSILQKHG